MSQDALQRNVVVHGQAMVAGALQHFYFAKRGFASTPSDTPPDTSFREVLQSAGSFSQDLFSGSRMGGRVTPGGGSITLINNDGALDSWLDGTYSVSGCQWATYRGPHGAAFPAGYKLVYVAYGAYVQASISQDADEVEVVLRDRAEQLDVPLAGAFFAGTGGIEGAPGTGQRKQEVLGDPGFVPAQLINAALQLYWVQGSGTGGGQDARFAAPADESVVMEFDVYVGGKRQPRGANYASQGELLSVAPAAGETRLWFGPIGPNGRNHLGPVLMRLGTAPAWQVRVFAAGYAPDGTPWRVNKVVERAGLSVPAYYSAGVEYVSARLVDSDDTYLSVLADAAVADSWFWGFNRRDELFSGTLAEPEDADTVLSLTTAAGTTAVAKPRYTFELGVNSENWRMRPVPGNEEPTHTVTMSAGTTYPCECDPTASATMREYLSRRNWWSVFTGTNPAIKAAHPGAKAESLSTRCRRFQSDMDRGRWVDNYLKLFGGARRVLEVEADITDEALDVDLFDNAIAKASRWGCSAGKPMRVTSRHIDLDRDVIIFGLWGGTAGPGGYLGGGGSAPEVVNPEIGRGLMDNFVVRGASSCSAAGQGSVVFDNFTIAALSSVVIPSTFLAHFEGSDGSTTITDSSAFARHGTGNTNCKITTAKAKFGSSCLKVTRADGGGGIVIGPHADYARASNLPWTFDCWVWVTTALNFTSAPLLLRWGDNNAAYDQTSVYSNAPKVAYDNEISGEPMTPSTISTGAWLHVAATFDGTDVRMFVDGALISTVARSIGASSTGTLYIGGNSGSPGSDDTTTVYIDEARFLAGYAVWTAGFTPPTAAYIA